ncbi:ROK family glucokinase [Faecalicatena contorta]|uniref:Glucokinase n=1 Tax=Faecalicatena contorta TaxID=39482 RepID=A0A315ZXU9_9FIRM|nr:ROK family glucokinase [Faecalicatena contorta]PWJ50481.1 glucokinase [Faecalicatena contorta]SUQ13889.1 glucokinase [Faecalicatena contorta]
MKRYAFGIDIGGTTLKLGLFKTNGELMEKWELPTRTEENGGYILTDIAEAIQQKLSDETISAADVAGIGLGVPGPVGKDGTVYRCVNTGWGILNVEQKLEALTGLKVRAGNDANVAALGEMWKGGGEGYRDLIMVTLGTGVGAGVIINGKIVSGKHGAAGEIGHMRVVEEELNQCTCGNHGCLEQYASARGIAAVASHYLKVHNNPVKVPTRLNNGKELTAKDIFDAAKCGDLLALNKVDEACKLLGKALAQISCVIDPEVFVIGGGLSEAGEILINGIQKYYQRYAFHASKDTVFVKARLGNDAGIYGGVKLVIE